MTRVWCGSTTRKATSSGIWVRERFEGGGHETIAPSSRPRTVPDCPRPTSRSSGAPPGPKARRSSVPRRRSTAAHLFPPAERVRRRALARRDALRDRALRARRQSKPCHPRPRHGRPCRRGHLETGRQGPVAGGLVAGEGRSARDHRPRSWWRAAADGLRRDQ